MKKKDDILEKKEIVENEKSLDGTNVEQKIEKAKEEKTVPAKKLPGILKKSYTRKKLNKLLNHIYVPTHRAMVEELFVPNPKKEGKFYIPRDKMLLKSQAKKLKRIGKEVASQKFSLRIIPLVATIIICIAVVLLVCTFKNVVVRKLLTNTMQGIFEAKTDIEYINVEILGSSVTIKGLYQGYKEDPMKNLFQFDKIDIDFNLTELLRGKFDLQNIAVEGINVMTARKTSAALPNLKASKNKFQLGIENKIKIAQEATKEELNKLFDAYNPKAILNNVQSQLKSPTVAKEVYTVGDTLVTKWKEKPAEISNDVKLFSEKVKQFSEADYSNLSDREKILDLISNITTLIKEGKKLTEKTKTLVNEVKVDAKQIKTSSVAIQNAIKNDTNFVKTEVNKIKSFKIKDGVKLLSGPIETIVYKVVGKYYPYLKQGVGLALEAKAQADQKPKVDEKPDSSRKRLPGKNIYYRRNTIPKFIIENMSVSGVNFAAKATDISSDMDKRGKPAIANLNLDIKNQNHFGDIIVDTRKNSTNPLVGINYGGTNYPVAFSTPVFGLDSSSVISGKLSVMKDGSVSIGADLHLQNLLFQTETFEPEYAYRLYSKALSYIDDMKVGMDLMFSNDDKFDLKLSSDADKQFVKVLTSLVNDELKIIIDSTLTKVSDLLNEKTNGAVSKLNEFIDLENGINSESIKLDKLNNLLEAKRKELEAKLENTAKNAAKKAIGDALGNLKLPF